MLASLMRRPVLGIFVVALTVRVIAASVIAVGWDGLLFLDDAAYSRLAELAANGAIQDSYDEFLYERTATLLVPITGLYALFGSVELLGQLVVALLGAATAALTTRLAMEILDRRFAVFAGLIVALLPSQILWSSLILKDAVVWAVLSALALVVAVAARSAGRRLALMGAAAAVLLVLLGFLRLHSLEVACVAIVLAVLAFPRPRPLARLTGAAVLLVCVPLTFGMGVAGSSFVADNGDPGYQRAVNAIEADSAVVAAPAPPAAPPDQTSSTAGTARAPAPRVPDKTSTEGGGAPTAAPPDKSSSDAGRAPAAASPKKTPTVPDPPPTPAPAPVAAPPDAPSPAVGTSLAYLPTGVTVVALRPWPWERSSESLGIRMARAETIVWYPLLLLALVGLPTVLRHRRTLAFPVLAGGAILAMYGLTEGNLGTAYRHRGEFVWVVAVLAALGAERIVTWRHKRRQRWVAA
ncbi:MAG: hypothetical protein M3417_14085 [Actinomycetota bacterium]|nr:hypothetical protein [Actinomycetota bacterium]